MTKPTCCYKHAYEIGHDDGGFCAGKYIEVRPLHEIAREIRKDWTKPYFGAVPYLSAMQSMDSIKDNYYCDSGRSIVAYFLANANTWKGENARRIKAELKGMLKG